MRVILNRAKLTWAKLKSREQILSHVKKTQKHRRKCSRELAATYSINVYIHKEINFGLFPKYGNHLCEKWAPGQFQSTLQIWPFLKKDEFSGTRGAQRRHNVIWGTGGRGQDWEGGGGRGLHIRSWGQGRVLFLDVFNETWFCLPFFFSFGTK